MNRQQISDHYQTLSDLATSSQAQYDRLMTPVHAHTHALSYCNCQYSTTPTTHHVQCSFDDITFGESFITVYPPKHESTPLDASILKTDVRDDIGSEKKIKELEVQLEELRAGMLAMMTHINSTVPNATIGTVHFQMFICKQNSSIW